MRQKEKHLILLFLWFTSTATVSPPTHTHFLSSHQYRSPTFVSFPQAELLCTRHMPIRQGPVTTGQSEPRDNEDVEGPGSEITGHLENEDPMTESRNRPSELAESVFCLQGGRCCPHVWLLWLCSGVVMF